MKDETLDRLIRAQNREDTFEYAIFTRPIGKDVDFGLGWDSEIKADLGDHLPYTFYFIKHDNECIGVVLDMTHDLHWYMVEKYRKKGYLNNALKSTILPHLAKKRTTQTITIAKRQIGEENFAASIRVAQLVGFKAVEEESDKKLAFILDLKKMYKKKLDTEICEGLDDERLRALRIKMNHVATSLHQIQVELEMKLGKSKYTKRMKHIVTELKLFKSLKLDDAVYDFEAIKRE